MNRIRWRRLTSTTEVADLGSGGHAFIDSRVGPAGRWWFPCIRRTDLEIELRPFRRFCGVAERGFACRVSAQRWVRRMRAALPVPAGDEDQRHERAGAPDGVA